MKTKVNYLFLCVIALLASCASNDELQFQVNPGQLNIVSEVGNRYLVYVDVPEGSDWNYEVNYGEGEKGWIIDFVRAANQLHFTVDRNYGTARTASILFKCTSDPSVSSSLPISQSATSAIDYDGFELRGNLKPESSWAVADWRQIDSYMRPNGWEYTEHPSNNDQDHPNGEHLAVVWDSSLQSYVFKFSIHANTEIIDGDRGTRKDRQRNEVKSNNHLINGNYDEWQIQEWKMKIPTGFQNTSSFTHLYQLKGIEGPDIKYPMITVSLYGDYLEARHDARIGGVKMGTLGKISKADVLGQWIKIFTKIHYCRHGYYKIVITRISDGEVLMKYENKDIDMWRIGGARNIRNKFGIYRMVGENPFGSYGLKDENLYIADFKVFDKNSNTNPEAVDD